MAAATGQVTALKREVHDHPGATARRHAAARERVEGERQERAAKALAKVPEIEAKKRGDAKRRSIEPRA